MHVELPLSLDDPKSLLPYEMIGMQYAIALTCFILWWKELDQAFVNNVLNKIKVKILKVLKL